MAVPAHALRPMCRTCGRHRLSVADTDGVCMFCAQPARVVVTTVKLCIDCGAQPRLSAKSSYCRACNAERAREYRAQRRERERHE